MLEEVARLVGWFVPIILLAVIILPQAIRILREYERGVIFRLGKLYGTKGPGLIFLIPLVDRMVKMDLRVVTIDVARQELMTRDNVPVTVDAVVYFRVVDPEAAVIRVENYLKATSLISQTTLRSVLGQAELDELLSQREKINLTLQEIIDRQTDPWGIKVTSVEVKDVVLPDGMKRAMARQAETERERRAKIINAEGEFQAAEKLVQAADDDFRATDCSSASVPADDEGNLQRAQHDDIFAGADRFVHAFPEKGRKRTESGKPD